MMGLYSRFVFPYLCEFALDNPIVADQRRQLLSTVDGTILEIGFGTGLNLPHYPTSVRLTTVDPNSGMHRLARRRIRRRDTEVTHVQASGESLPFDAGQFDCVVSTFTLCSIRGVTAAMTELFRVLKPRGRFFFLEHGLSPDPQVQAWQRRLNGIQSWCGDGCQLTRNIRDIVVAQPFTKLDLSTTYLDKTPRTHGYVYRGVATK